MGVSRKAIMDFLGYMFGASSVVMVDSDEGEFKGVARHVCFDGKGIMLLNKRVINVDYGINAEVFFCDRCRKLIVCKDSITDVSM